MSRYDRQAQLSQLESVIEKKKKEIQARQEAQKKKETEEALLKIQKQEEPDASRPFWKKGEHAKEYAPTTPIKNVFSNDGSFLDQFKKLTGSGLTPKQVDVETLAKLRKAEEYEKERKKRVEEEKQQREIERKEREAERKRKWERDRDRDRDHCLDEREHSNSHGGKSPPRKTLDSNIKLDLPPPGVVQLVPTAQVPILTPVVQQQPIPPLMQQPLQQPPIIQPQSNLIFTQLSPPPLVINPTTNPPPFTTNEIQMKAAGITLPDRPTMPIINRLEPNPVARLVPPYPPPTNFPPPPFLPSSIQNTPPPINIPPPNMTLRMSINVNDGMRSDYDSLSDDRKRRRRRWEDAKPNSSVQFGSTGGSSSSFDGNPGWFNANASSNTNIISGDGEVDDVRLANVATMVAENGDSFEHVLRQRSRDEPHLRFLMQPDSQQYAKYRQLVYDIRTVRSRSDSGGDSPPNPDKYDPAECGDSDDDDDCGGNPEIGDNDSNSKLNMDNDGYRADGEDNVGRNDSCDSYVDERPSFLILGASNDESTNAQAELIRLEKKAKRKSRWGDKAEAVSAPTNFLYSQTLPNALQLPPAILPTTSIPHNAHVMLSQVNRKDPGLLQYAVKTFGSTALSEEDWKRAEDHYKVNLLYQDMMKKRAELDRLAKQGKFKYDYDSDEDTEGGTWEHKLRQQEMQATQLWADELTKQASGKHHIGDFLPPDELKRFMEKYDAVKQGNKEPDLSDYKEFKLKEDNVGYQLLQKMGWSEGKGLGQAGGGIVDPVNKAKNRFENAGLGLENPDGINTDDDEYDAYRKRMMLAYRFRPNPLNNPRRPYY